ncbi:histidine phosphatase superfamily [Pavlovales sp. CCMP2436]|nr:histidine phosphatase superfamily [Pavlovales sp. CCMP2436]
MLTVLAMTVATSTTPRRFLVARHGETTWNKIEKLQGTLDESTLTPSGEAQALELGRAVAAEEAGSIHAVFVSSLGRARQTHEIVRAQFPESMEVPEATHTYELREIALGKWEVRGGGGCWAGGERREGCRCQQIDISSVCVCVCVCVCISIYLYICSPGAAQARTGDGRGCGRMETMESSTIRVWLRGRILPAARVDEARRTLLE